MSIYEKTNVARALLYWAKNKNFGNEAYYLEDRMYAVADGDMVIILAADSYDEAIRKAKARDKRMTLKDMISTLRTVNFEKVEIRDKWGNEICTCPTYSAGWKEYQERKVVEWFPHGAPFKEATFTVFID